MTKGKKSKTTSSIAKIDEGDLKEAMRQMDREYRVRERFKDTAKLRRRMRPVEAAYILNKYQLKQEAKGNMTPFHHGWMEELPYDDEFYDFVAAAWWKLHNEEIPK